MNIYAKFQLHPPYGFWEEDFWIFFFENLAFRLPWQPIKDSGYPHDGHANKNHYPHNRRADKDSYPHDSNN